MKHLKLFEEFNFDFDYIDLPEEEYLYHQKSQIPNAGDGLFTAIDIMKNEVISVYKGEILNGKEADIRKKAGDDGYFMDLPNGKILDAKNTEGFAKYANDARGTKFKNNSVIAMDEKKIVLVATKTIKSGQEIFTSYGNKYWSDKSI